MALNVLTKPGIFDRTVIQDLFLPLFRGKDISIDITLLELYQLNHREIHFITTEINTMKMEDVSYKTHPDWKVVDAVYASCCLPFLFSPFFLEEKKQVFIDGGILMHFPLNYCLSLGYDPEEIMAIRRVDGKTSETTFHSKNTFFEMIFSLILKLIEKIDEIEKSVSETQIGCSVEIRNTTHNYNLYSYIYNCIYSEEVRRELIELGVRSVPLESNESPRGT
jgi:predicted acylesterase/phospholipase RssA